METYSIQYILYEESEISHNFKGPNVIITKMESPRSLDEFTINVIDLSNEKIWRYDGESGGSLNCIADFGNLKTMIENTHNAEIVVLFPQECNYYYGFYRDIYGGNGKYYSQVPLKNILQEIVIKMMKELIPIPDNCLIYENTETTIREYQFQASFHFNSDRIHGDSIFLTKSNTSQKNTTMKFGDYYYSTLNINTYDKLICFLDKIKLIKLVEDVPEWISSMHMFDDVKQIETITNRQETIKQCNSDIEVSQAIINKNNRYKSILYTNGNELITVVFEMLENMLSCDLSDFCDEKKEDFLIKFDDITFIGEIKGVTSNVKAENVSQLEVHYRGYMDKLEEESRTENVKAILIMDHQRNNELEKRQPVHNNQIKLAERNGSLIVETVTLLKLYEKFVSGDSTSEEVKNIFSSNVGLLEI